MPVKVEEAVISAIGPTSFMLIAPSSGNDPTAHQIHMTDSCPFRLSYWRVSLRHYQMQRQLSDMEEKGIIQKSFSRWASRLALVWKKNGVFRVCVDYRWLKSRSMKDAHALPQRAACLAALRRSTVFSAKDLASGY